MASIGIYLDSIGVNYTILFSIVGNLGCSKQKCELQLLKIVHFLK